MAKIFISTDYDLLNKVIGDRKNQKGINLLETNNLIYFNDALKSFQVEKIDDTMLFLVKDTTNSDQLSFATNKQRDYLMCHSTCNHTSLFERIHTQGQHEQKDPYYTRVLDIILDDGSDKAERIIDFLFNPTKITNADGSTLEKTIQDAQEAYKSLHKKLTFDFIKYKSSESGIHVSGAVKSELNIVSQYYDNKGSDENVKKKLTVLKNQTTLDLFYHSLQAVHPDIEKLLFE